MKRRIAFAVAVVAIAVAANFLGSLLARLFSLPLYLDSALQLIDPYMIPFTPCHICTALLASLTFATYFSGLLMNFADKTISALVSFAAYLLADRYAGNL